MILEFTISNFRSIKDTTVFSLIAESSKAKANNITAHRLATDDVRLLNSAVIYGPNGSGKSNVLRAFYNLLHFIKNNESKAGQEIDFYDPFLFDLDTDTKQVSFNLNFIGPENVKYSYIIEFNKRDVTKEELSYFPKGKETSLFKRTSEGSSQELTHIGKLGSSLGNKEVKVFHNRLILAKFGEEDASEELLTKIFVHFDKYEVVNSHSHLNSPRLKNEILQLFADDTIFNQKLNDLIQRSDLKIKKVEVEPNNPNDFKFRDKIPEDLKRILLEQSKHRLFGVHDLFQGNMKVSERLLPFKDESKGTNSLFLLGGKILSVLNTGGCLFVDELETSFHPDLSRTLVELFHSTATNPLGAQLVFTTHDVTLLSRSLFRKDQIWFTEKNDTGATELFSAQDFKEAREDTPFDRWYMAGKFGALPFIDLHNDSSQD
jgi:AAA15 family ATPase/GTPase